MLMAFHFLPPLVVRGHLFPHTHNTQAQHSLLTPLRTTSAKPKMDRTNVQYFMSVLVFGQALPATGLAVVSIAMVFGNVRRDKL